MNKIGGYAVATDTSVYLAVAGACPRGDRAAQLVQDSSGHAAARTAMPGGAVTAQLQKYPFTTQGAVINGTKSGPHRAWDPV